MGLVFSPSGGLMSFPSTVQRQCGISVHHKCAQFPAGKFTVLHCSSLHPSAGMSRSPQSPGCPPGRTALGEGPSSGSGSMFHPSACLGERRERIPCFWGQWGWRTCLGVWEMRRTCRLLTAAVQVDLCIASAMGFSGSCLGND